MTHQIQLKRRLAATVDEVYAAWTDGRSLSQWMVPIIGGRTEAVTDARVGGAYRIDMFGLSGQSAQQGQYLRLERPRLRLPHRGSVWSLLLRVGVFFSAVVAAGRSRSRVINERAAAAVNSLTDVRLDR